MASVDDAIAFIQTLKPGESFTYRVVARKYGCSHQVLSCRHKSISVPRNVQISEQYMLNPQQESEPLKYMQELTERLLPPMRMMVQNFA
jgi:hypothetical protein